MFITIYLSMPLKRPLHVAVLAIPCQRLQNANRSNKSTSLENNCKAVLPGCTVGSRQAEHESHRESMEEDDMVMRVGNSLRCL